MKIISMFNNKGGVGKTTLAFHVACALAEMGKKVLMLDLDPQCNLTVCSMDEETLHEIWREEDQFIADFDEAKKTVGSTTYQQIISKVRTIHFLLKPTEQGTAEIEILPPALQIRDNLDLIPGRISLHMFEYKISERWAGTFLGDPLAIRTITQIRNLAQRYTEENHYDYVIVDTSPSLGVFNKVIISTVDGFIVPCLPDMFSMYGIRNIGSCLIQWKKEFDTMFSLISDVKRENFPKEFVQFLGYTIYNARRYKGETWDLAIAHYNYAKQIPSTIKEFISPEVRKFVPDELIEEPIGNIAVMHTHNTLPGMNQKYKVPIWDVPNHPSLESGDRGTISGNRASYEATKEGYCSFVTDLLVRIERLPK